MHIVVSEFISLDGVVQAPGGKDEDTDGGFRHGGWSMPYFDPETMGGVIGDLMSRTDALLFGRRTWEGMAAAWPEQAGDPFADTMNSIKKYVVSTTLDADEAAARWDGTIVLRDLDDVRKLREAEEGGLQVVGSASIAQALLAADLVDELWLMLEPILLGGGKTVFPADGAARPLELTSVTQTPTGVVICGYRAAR